MIDEDITRATTLPARLYRDPAVFERVCERVLARSWQVVDGAERARGPGDVVPFTFLEGSVPEPLLLVRDASGTLRALSNVCTHRGNLLCTEPGTLRSLRCRYHGRRFGLDGRMLSSPGFEGARDFPTAADDLSQIPVGPFGPLVFAAIDPVCTLEELLAPVRARIGFFPLASATLDPASSRSFEVAANWALYCDNYLEGLHVPYVHPSLARAIDQDSYRTELDAWSSVQIARATDPRDAFDGSDVAAYYFFLFPTTMLNVYPWGISLNRVVPLAIDRTRIDYRAFVVDPSRRGRGAGAALDQVEREDDAIVEQVQRGIRARLYVCGRYAPTREAGVHHFHRLLVRLLGEA